MGTLMCPEKFDIKIKFHEIWKLFYIFANIFRIISTKYKAHSKNNLPVLTGLEVPVLACN